MQISIIIEEQQAQFASQISELVWATGAVSYDYHFARRALFDAVVLGSWRTPDSNCSLKQPRQNPQHLVCRPITAWA